MKQDVIDSFAAAYSAKPAAYSHAPGRLEILGNHTDYNEGFVFSAAIDKGTFFAVAPSADTTCTLTAGNVQERKSLFTRPPSLP